MRRGLLNLGLTLMLGLILYWAFARPWVLRWGATAAEVAAPMPGDDLIPHPRLSATRAVSIRASADRVWPWVAQLGQDRAGFYTYDFIENALGARIHNTLRIEPRWQSITPGDELKLAHGMPGVPVFVVQPGRTLGVFADSRVDRNRIPMPPGTSVMCAWVFDLRDAPDGTTRLVSRWQVDWSGSSAMTVMTRGVVEWGAFIMERRMLLGIRDLAEQSAGAAHIPNWSDRLWFASLWLDGLAVVVAAFARRRRAALLTSLLGAPLTLAALFFLPPTALAGLPITAVLAFLAARVWRLDKTAAVA